MDKKWKKLIFQLLPGNQDFSQFLLTVALKSIEAELETVHTEYMYNV